MDIEKRDYYKEHLDEYIKEVLGYELLTWQSHILKEYVKSPNKQWIVNIGRTPAKRMFFEVLEKVKNDLL